jgi:hypothetical protein
MTNGIGKGLDILSWCMIPVAVISGARRRSGTFKEEIT